jgi:transposase
VRPTAPALGQARPGRCAEDAQFHDLGPEFYAARIDPERRKRSRVRQLEALGYSVTLQPAA